MNAKAVIPPRSNRKLQRNYDRALYKLRNRIERCFSKLKHFRLFATRYEKSSLLMDHLAAICRYGLENLAQPRLAAISWR